MWRWLSAVRTQERGRFAFFLGLGVLLGMAQTAGQAAADTLFLARLGSQHLPLTWVLASAVTVLASFLYALRVGRQRNDRVFIEVLLVFAAGVAAAWVALRAGYTAALPALQCLYYAAQAVLVSHFWSFAGDFFDTLAAKRLVPSFAVGMSLGSAAGGALAGVVNDAWSTEAVLGAWTVGLAATAVFVIAGRSRFPRWRSLSPGEADEASVAGMSAAVRYVRRSPLGRWLVVSALAMVLAMFVMQYLYLDVFQRAFPDEAALGRFVGNYLFFSNLVEMAVEVAVTPVLIRRVGVPTANLVHPGLSVLAFGGLFASYRLPAGVAARANRELLDNALSGPIRNLSYNALPQRFRARVRAFLEGIVIYSGMSLAGLALLAARGLDTRELCAAGAALAVVYGFANLRVRRAYLNALATELRAGRLDLRELQHEIGAGEVAQLAAIFERLVREEEAAPSGALLALPPLLVEHGLAEPVRAALAHPSPRMRAACLEALAEADASDTATWRSGLEDPDPGVRCAAARALPDAALAELEAPLRARLADADADVRAEAARRLGAAGAATLASMLEAPEPETALAALRALADERVVQGEALSEGVAARLSDPDPRLRAAALAALAQGRPARLGLDELGSLVADPDASVRRAALRVLARRGGDGLEPALAHALRDGARDVRTEAVLALAARGEAGVAAASEQLAAPEESAVRAALRVLGASGTPRARVRLRAEYAARVREAWESLLLARALPAGGAHGFLHLACVDDFARSLRIAFRALARLEDERVVRSVDRALRFAGGRGTADALEVISHLGDREASRVLVLLLERIPVEEKLASLRSVAEPPRDETEALARARKLGSPWVRLALGDAAESSAETAARESTMERLLSLRQVSLFAGLSLERLQAIERITTDAEYVKGEVMMREGEPGDDLYLLVEGEVDVVKGAGTPAEEHLNRLGPGSYVGEMAVLDGGLRSATIVATSHVRVLVLAGPRLRELVHEMPDLAFDLFRVLTERLRGVEERLVQTGARTA
ncbi:MAG TPA: cyclic nucleotide-binding domain-containing protein [Myxococcota bacterium]|nr:cyclic nucleotide-binding domain-containing protein [Myxococcota bacterium]